MITPPRKKLSVQKNNAQQSLEFNTVKRLSYRILAMIKFSFFHFSKMPMELKQYMSEVFSLVVQVLGDIVGEYDSKISETSEKLEEIHAFREKWNNNGNSKGLVDVSVD